MMQIPFSTILQETSPKDETGRLSQASDVCSTLTYNRTWPPPGRRHQKLPIYYCRMPKVASTFLDGFLPNVFQSPMIMSNANFQAHHNTTQTSGTFTFVFVRDPYVRLLSAYENKLFLPNSFWREIGIDIIKTVRKPLTSLDTGHDVTFSEMLKYVVSLYRKGVALNPHLVPMHEMCNPCAVDFDFIGKLETMGSDLQVLMDSWHNAGYINKSIGEKVLARSKSSLGFGPVTKLFTESRRHNKLNKSDLFLRTWASYQIRGLILKQFKMPFTATLEAVREHQYRDAVKKAWEQSKDRKEELKTQREEALVQAYQTVPLDLMQELRTFVKRDCQLYGYDDMPDKLFSINITSTNSFNYFKGLSI